MREIPKDQILRRMQTENVWWKAHRINPAYDEMTRRAYFDLLLPLVRERGLRRAVLLMGPRRVGKTVLMHHVIQHLLGEGVDPRRVGYLSVDHPIFNGCGLEDLMGYCSEASGVDYRTEPCFLFFDEVQYLKEWEVHLKTLVDTYPNVKFVASGSAAAALRLKSNESGAGRFTDFLLPPLTFHEYLTLLGEGGLVRPEGWKVEDLALLNERFVHYLNFGGYPEVIFSELIQSDPVRFVKGDIIDKVLLRDLPGLYGIQDIQELNYLFTTLAFNTADEVSLEQLSRSSGVAKNTIKRYIEYLEAAFLLKTVHRIDRTSRRFQRANFFKVYLTNPSMRSALFSPITADDPAMGSLAETGIYSQWFHVPAPLHYARWKGGEVDIVSVGPNLKAAWAVEVKWSDRFWDQPGELRSLVEFSRANVLERVKVTTRTASGTRTLDGLRIDYVPASLYCFMVGYQLVHARRDRPDTFHLVEPG